MNPFLGTWVGPDEYTAEVEYSVFEKSGEVVVQAVDPSDGEAADVSEVQLSNNELVFTVLWPSTGRIAKCRFRLATRGEVILTFTFTDHARLIKKHA